MEEDKDIQNYINGLNENREICENCRREIQLNKFKVNINDFSNQHGNKFGNGELIAKLGEKEVNGRFPANTILTYDDSDVDEVCGGMPDSKGASSQNNYSNGHIYGGRSLQESKTRLTGYREWYNDNGSASRYFKKCSYTKKDEETCNSSGRFPANTILTYDDSDYEEVCGGMPIGGKNGSITQRYKMNNQIYGDYGYCNTWNAYEDSGSASRYFYCAKASKKDRDEGLRDFKEVPLTITENKGRTFNDRCAICGKKFIGSPETICHCENPITDKTKSAPRKNIHPTVKPTTLMQYLVRLVSPKGATILDPFNGSGSTGKAVMWENRERERVIIGILVLN